MDIGLFLIWFGFLIIASTILGASIIALAVSGRQQALEGDKWITERRSASLWAD